MIDLERLRQLEEDFGAEDLDDLIEIFLDETREGLEALAPLIEQGDPEALRDQFHFLKGCARNVGASEFADRCERFEKSSAVATGADYQMLRGDFQAICDWFTSGGLRQTA